jgi:hypothetical protein
MVLVHARTRVAPTWAADTTAAAGRKSNVAQTIRPVLAGGSYPRDGRSVKLFRSESRAERNSCPPVRISSHFQQSEELCPQQLPHPTTPARTSPLDLQPNPLTPPSPKPPPTPPRGSAPPWPLSGLPSRGCNCGRQDRGPTPVGLGSVPVGGSGWRVCAVGRGEWRSGAESRAGAGGELSGLFCGR